MQTTQSTNDTTSNTSTIARWTIDPMHTSVTFGVRHLMITNVRGAFTKVAGTVRYDGARPEATEVSVEIPAASIDTREPQRDAHLRSGDFFDVERFPTITFRSTKVRVGDAGLDAIDGELTIRGVTRPVTLAVSEITREQKDHRGEPRIGASATAKIKRSDFGIVYNKVLEAGGVAIADEVHLAFDVSLVKG